MARGRTAGNNRTSLKDDNYMESSPKKEAANQRTKINEQKTSSNVRISEIRQRGNKRKVKKRKVIVSRVVVLGVLLIAIVAAISAALYYNDYNEKKDILNIETIYNNIYLENINVGGLTKEQAKELLENKLSKNLDNKVITILYENKEYPFTFKELGAGYDIDGAVEYAYEYAREGSVQKRYDMFEELVEYGEYHSVDFVCDKEKVKEAIKGLESEIYEPAKNPSAKRQVNGGYSIENGENGIMIDIDKTADSICQILETKTEADIYATIKEIEPEHSSDELTGMNDLIGSYDTSYYGGASEPRVINMTTASKKLNQTVVYPGEVFSTNECFGESTAENGYAKAATIVSGKIVDDYGGGVCQVSTTLYNAVLYAELEVVERQNHSLKVGYADYAYDATLAGDYIDFKFKNDTDTPIYIECVMTSSKVICNLYGKEIHDPSRTLKFENSLIETIEPGEDKVTYDNTMYEDEKVAVSGAQEGYRYKLYKLVYENGKEVEKVEVNTSYYMPVEAEIKIGTKKREAPVEEAPVIAEEVQEPVMEE
ncbi:MAG: VanW family protein [Firmicutes bacterium]|nr:VanW family protein [Bacillota bacterium]